MKPRRHDMLDLHPAAFVGALLGGDPYEASAVDAEPDTTASERRALGRLTGRLRRRRERAVSWARAQSGRLPT
jgi:protein-L-isoaspartate O-methyltransferase